MLVLPTPSQKCKPFPASWYLEKHKASSKAISFPHLHSSPFPRHLVVVEVLRAGVANTVLLDGEHGIALG